MHTKMQLGNKRSPVSGGSMGHPFISFDDESCVSFWA